MVSFKRDFKICMVGGKGGDHWALKQLLATVEDMDCECASLFTPSALRDYFQGTFPLRFRASELSLLIWFDVPGMPTVADELAALRQVAPKLPVLVLTGEDKQAQYTALAAEYQTKILAFPVQEEAFLAYIRTLLQPGLQLQIPGLNLHL